MTKPSANERFAAAARQLGIEPEIRRFSEDTRTAEQAAAAIGCELAQIVKSLVFEVGGQPVLVLASGANRVSTAKVSEILGGEVGRAEAGLVRDATGFAIGGIPPFGHRTPLRTTIDRQLMDHDVVFGAAGTPDSVFPVAPDLLVAASGGTVADIAEDG
jgi:prolyl-tRNA editing enzyme YbaK/EbsC (Cys-tRNA(Pro) deacylase)